MCQEVALTATEALVSGGTGRADPWCAGGPRALESVFASVRDLGMVADLGGAAEAEAVGLAADLDFWKLASWSRE